MPFFLYNQNGQQAIARPFLDGVPPSGKPGPSPSESQGWDFGWVMLRSDGKGVYRRCDPYTVAFNDQEVQHAVRWFVS